MLGLISKLLGPVLGVIDKAVTDKDLKRQIEAEITAQLLDAESELNKAASSIIRAEAQGESWLQRNWRPLTMLSFLGLIWAYWLGLAPAYVTDNPFVVGKVFDLLTIGIGGYIGGRTVEKSLKTWKGE